MKKTFRLLATAIMALLLTTGFTACSSDDDGASPEPPASNNFYMQNGEKVDLKSAELDIFDYHFYDTKDIKITFCTKNGKHIYLQIDNRLINKTTDLSKLESDYLFIFDADDTDFPYDIDDWEYVSNNEEKVKSGTLTVNEISKTNEYEIILEYVKNSIDEITFEDRTVKFYYKGTMSHETRKSFDYYLSHVGHEDDIIKVSYNAETLKNKNLYDITIKTTVGDINVQLDERHLGTSVSLANIDPLYSDNPFRIQASDSYGLEGKEFLFGGKNGTYSNTNGGILIKKISNTMYLISFYYKKGSDFTASLNYFGEMKAE